jgi:RNA polymerase sigma-70 factor (ECF subfamily)
MTGSIADGEDVVQDTLARAFYALATLDEVPALRPWLFRVAHNAAIDFNRRHARLEFVAEPPEVVADAPDDEVDPEALRAALATFLALPPLQRSAVILKDVLGHRGEEIARTLGTTVAAVKSALVRGRTRLREAPVPAPIAAPRDGNLDAYARLFNAGDWDGVRAMLAEDVRLDLVAKSTRQGKAVGHYFGRYAGETDLRVSIGALDGRPVLWVFTPRASAAPRYFIELGWRDGKVSEIKDFRYVPYIAAELGRAAAQV